jgi:uncharacterized protein YbjT (DUF2867 family)
MASEHPRILVTGATGQTGGAVVARLSALRIPVRALVRSAAKATALSALPHVEVVSGDLAQPDTLEPALAGIDRAFLVSTSDPHMLDVQVSFVDAARAARVRHVVKLSGIIADLDSPFRFARMHRGAELAVERSGMAWTHLRAGEFMPAYFRQIPNIVGRSALMLPMADARIASIDVGDVADVAVRMLTTDGHAGNAYSLTGSTAHDMTEIAQLLTAAVGKPIRYVDVPPEQARAAQLAAGMPAFNADALFELFAERRAGKESAVYPTVEQLLGRAPTSFAAFAARNASVFKGEAPPK